MWTVICGLILIVILIQIYFRNVYNYWKKRKIPTPPYQYFFGNYKDMLTMKKNPGQIVADIYHLDEFKDLNYIGMYKCMEPALLIRSPEIIKEVMVTNFDSFCNNDFQIDESVDVIFGKNPFFLKAPKWREVRNQVTPSFSGSKIKSMIPLIQETCTKLINYLDSTEESVNEVGLECKELSSKYTCENVASCAFGINGRSFIDPQSQMRTISKKLTEPSAWTAFIGFVLFVFPKLASILKIEFIRKEDVKFLRKLIRDTISFRKENKIVRKDVIDMMCALREKINDELKFNEDDVLAHAGGFLFDGIETSSASLAFILYELAANVDVQNKLKKEIDEVLNKYNGEVTHEVTLEMNYLDCVIKESLRKYPPILNFMKVCTKPYKMPPIKEDGTGPELNVEVGTPICIPFHALQMDPKHFPDPERFDPDRFSDENKDKIAKYTYIPFGEGPRMCLGMKFALQQIKMMLITLVSKYELKVNKKTKEPLEFDPKSFLIQAEGGIWLNFIKRNN